MNILAIECTHEALSAAVLSAGIVTEAVSADWKKAAESLVPLVEQVMTRSGLNRQELEGIAISSGPGSFTALRIGMSVAKGIAYGHCWRKGNTSFAGTDNKAAGKAGGASMLKLIGSGKKIGLIAGLAGNVTSNARIDGFKAGAAGSTFVGPVNADWDTTKALDAANAMLVANPDLDGFFAANDQMAQGIARAVAAAKKNIPIYGVDGIADALKEVKAGTITASISQYPYVMGQMGVEACIIAAQGGKVPAQTITPYYVIDKSNIDKALTNKSTRGYFPNQTPPGAFKNPYTALIKK